MAAMRRNFGGRHWHLINVWAGYRPVLKDFCLSLVFFVALRFDMKKMQLQNELLLFSLPLPLLWKRMKTKCGKRTLDALMMTHSSQCPSLII